jgi:TIR domain
MTTFLSWSGETSRMFAEELKPWLETVLPNSEVWVSSQDLDKGTIWFTEIINKLQSSDAGIVCITRENKLAPWLHFEAGALIKGMGRHRVGTILLDLDFGDLHQPLSQFNGTRVNRLGMFQLVKSLNNMSAHPILDRVLDRTFEKFWPELESAYKLLFPDSHAAVRDLPDPVHFPPAPVPPTGVIFGQPPEKKKSARKSDSEEKPQPRLFNGEDEH